MRHNMDYGRAGRHCHNCLHLEWAEGDEGDSKGWICNKRNYETAKHENKHFKQLDSKEYRFKGKRCFEPKPEAKNVQSHVEREPHGN